MNNDGIKITGIFELNISKIINNRKTIVGKYIDKNLVVNLGKEKREIRREQSLFDYF